jgi:uncharacterized protein (TIGR03437 family)
MKNSLCNFQKISLVLLAGVMIVAVQVRAQQPTWGVTDSLSTARSQHTATLMDNGKVLVAGGNTGGASITGSAEVYDPATGAWNPTGNLNTPRQQHIAVKLQNGKVLVAGGGSTNPVRSLTSAELYDPQTGTWSVTGDMNTSRANPVAVLLQNGKVLVAGGVTQPGFTFIQTAEVYDPATGKWSSAGTLNSLHGFATLTLLPNGKALIVGGLDQNGAVKSCELYDPAANTWTSTGDLPTPRASHAATLLSNGKVLVSGGRSPDVAESDLYDPATGQWSASGNIGTPRGLHTATLLQNGKVLIAGGQNGNNLSIKSAEVYDPVTGTWTATADLNQARDRHTATLLPNGKVLVAGGSLFTGSGLAAPLSSAELFDSGVAVVATVSAASFAAGGAPESIVSAFGSNLATGTQVASELPLPTSLAGTSVKVRDSAGVERAAPLFFVAPQQINYQIPPGTAIGNSVVTVTSSGNTAAAGIVEITSVAPGLFAANANGQGVAAAQVFRLKANGAQSFEPVAQFDSGQVRFVPVPIDLGPESDQVFLILYGTGIKFRSALSAVNCTIGGVGSEVLFADAAPGFVGLDQVNVRLARSLAGRGEVDVTLTVDGRGANPVRVSIR